MFPSTAGQTVQITNRTIGYTIEVDLLVTFDAVQVVWFLLEIETDFGVTKLSVTTVTPILTADEAGAGVDASCQLLVTPVQLTIFIRGSLDKFHSLTAETVGAFIVKLVGLEFKPCVDKKVIYKGTSTGTKALYRY